LNLTPSLAGFGFFTAAATAANMQNRIYAYLCARNGDSGQPEYRVRLTRHPLVVAGTDSASEHPSRTARPDPDRHALRTCESHVRIRRGA
jgi:hypothetical protein